MAINKKLIHFEKRANFNTRLANNEINNTSIVFIQDTGELWTHGKFFCTTATNLSAAPNLLTVGDTIAVEIGDKTSNYIVPPAALKGRTMYECITDTADTRGHWTGTVPGVTELYDGLVIHVRFTTAYYGSSEGYNTLNINGLGPKIVWYRYNSVATSHWSSNAEVTLTYRTTAGSYKVSNANGELTNGTTYTDGWVADYAYYSYTDYMSGSYYYRYKVNANGYIGRYMIVMRCPDGTITGLTTTNNSTATTKTMFSGPLLLDDVHYYSSTNTYAANAVFTHDGGNMKNNAGLVDVRYTFNCGSTLVANKSFFIVGTIGNDGYFYLDQTQPWSLDYPTTEDNKLYILIGPCYDTYRVNFELFKPIYIFKNGKLQLYAQYAAETEWANITGKPSTFTPSAHDHDDRYLLLAGGTMVGHLKWTDTNALPLASTANYFVTIDAFADGGTTKWISKANALTSLTGLTSSAKGSITTPIYWTGTAFDTVQATFGSQNYGEHNANNIKSNGLWYYTSNGPATTLGASHTDGALYSQAYSTSWAAQIAQDYRNGNLFTRGLSNGTWTTWRKVWNDGNDGADSGLDADLLDGQHGSYYLSEANLTWGGKNFSGNYGPVDAALVSELGANRTAFAKAAGIAVEYSNDNGTTWNDYGLNDAQRTGIFSTSLLIIIGKKATNNVANANDLVRVRLLTSAASLYTVLNKFIIFLATTGSTGCWCTITGRTQENYENGVNTFVTFANQVPVSGWSGWNVININGITTYGNTKGSQYGELIFTFGATGYNGNGTTQYGLNISKIRCFGGQGWITPSTMAASGHLYSYDNSQNATFPAQVTATKFVKSGGTSSQFLKADGSVDSNTYSTTSHTHAWNSLTRSSTTANLVIVSTSTANGWELKTLGSNAFDSTGYLPLVGGTLSGDLTIKSDSGDSPKLIFQRGTLTDSLDDWRIFDTGGNLKFLRTTGSTTSWQDYVVFSPTAGNVIINGSTALHSGNYTTYTVLKDGTGATGTWGIGITGNAGTATQFESALSVTLTGDTTGTASSLAGWSIATTTNYLSGNNTATLTTAPGTGKMYYRHTFASSTAGLFATTNNANGVFTFNRYTGNYDSLLGFSSDGNIYYRAFNNAALNTTTAWKQIAFTDSNITGQASYAANVGSAGTLGTNYVTAAKVIAACNWYDTVSGTDLDAVINRWDEIVSFVSGFEETPDLATYLANNYLAKTGNSTASPMTGTIYVKDVNPLVLLSTNQDLDIWRVTGNTTGSLWDNTFGFYLRYNGTGLGNDNSLSLWANNQTSNDVEVYRVKLDGILNFLKAPTINGTAISLTTHNHDDRYLKLTGTTDTVKMAGNIEWSSESSLKFYAARKKESISSGWAKEFILFKDPADTVFARIGILGNSNNFSYIFIGTGVYDAPNNLRIYTDRIQFGTNVIVHEGNYATTTDTRYLKLSGGTLTGALEVPSSTTSGGEHTKGINLSSIGHLGAVNNGSTTVGVGLYSSSKIWIRPGLTNIASGTIDSTKGIVLDATTFTFNGTNVSLEGHNHNDLYVTSVGVTDDTTNHANLLRYIKNGTSTYFTVPFATLSDTTNKLNLTYINTEADISTSGVHAYAGNGASWTGSIASMKYAGILTIGGPSRGYQLWTDRGADTGGGLKWRRGNADGSDWGAERVILDTGNYTSYTVLLNGTGASGTWGISISGTAVTANNINKSTLGYLYLSATTTTGSTGTVATTSGKIGVPIQFYGSQVNYALNLDLFYATVASNAITANTIYLGDNIKSKTFVKTSTHVPAGVSSGSSSSSGLSGESIVYTAGEGIKIAGTLISTNTWTGTESQFAELANPSSYDLIYIIED